MVHKINSIFDEILQIYTKIKKWFEGLCKGNMKKTSTLNILRKKGTSLTLGEDELLAERVASYPCLYEKICKEHKEKDAVENAWKKVAEESDFIDNRKYSCYFVFAIAFVFLMPILCLV